MKKENYLSWSSYFMSIAVLSSYRSKDRKTQNGACIVDRNNKIIGIGYNGLPKGCDDNDPDFWADDDDNILQSKHTYVVHAEQNAIYNCMLNDLSGTTIYVTQFPCHSCAQAIIQVGISKVVYMRRKEGDSHQQYFDAVAKMFGQADVVFELIDDQADYDTHFIDGVLKLAP